MSLAHCVTFMDIRRNVLLPPLKASVCHRLLTPKSLCRLASDAGGEAEMGVRGQEFVLIDRAGINLSKVAPQTRKHVRAVSTEFLR